MKNSWRYVPLFGVLVLLSTPVFILGAASSSSSSSVTATDVQKVSSYRYYSPENLQRINDINEQLRALGHAPRQKHAPLMIFADPDEVEKPDAALEFLIFSSSIMAIFSSDFNPALVLSFSLLENIMSGFDADRIALLQQKYSIYDVPGTQLIVLLPHWYQEFYGTNSGFDMRRLKRLDAQSLAAWYEQKSRVIRFSKKFSAHRVRDVRGAQDVIMKRRTRKLHAQFVRDLKIVFAPHTLKSPIWDVWFGGHGTPKNEKNEIACIGGLVRSAFLEVLSFFSEAQKVGIFYVQSCYAGGVNAHFITQKLESWKRPLSYDLILGSSGDAMTSIFFDQSGALSGTWNFIVENYFQAAALVATHVPDHLRKESLQSVFDALIEMSSIGTLGLHGTENLPQVRLKGSARFKFLKDIDSRYFIVNSKSARAAIEPSAKTQTLLMYTPSIDKLVLMPCFRKQQYNLSELQCNALKLFTDISVTNGEELIERVTYLLRQHLLRIEGGGSSAQNRLMYLLLPSSLMRFFQKNMSNELLDGYDRCLFSSVDDLYKKIDRATQSSYPEFMLMMPQKYLSQEQTHLHIKELILNSDNPLIGIHAFFLNSFLATPSRGLRVIDIDSLIGNDDISILCRLMQSFTELRLGHVIENASEDVATNVIQNFVGHFQGFVMKRLAVEDALQKVKNNDLIELKNVRIVVGAFGMTVWFSLAGEQFKLRIESLEIPGKVQELWPKQYAQFYEPVPEAESQAASQAADE